MDALRRTEQRVEAKLTTIKTKLELDAFRQWLSGIDVELREAVEAFEEIKSDFDVSSRLRSGESIPCGASDWHVRAESA